MLAARTRIEHDPAYSFVAARALLRGLYAEALGRRVGIDEAAAAYPRAFVDVRPPRRRAGAAGAGDARLRPGAAGRGAGAGAGPRLPVPRPADPLRPLSDPPPGAAAGAAADALDAGGDGAGAAGGRPRGAGDRVLQPDLVLPLLPLDADALQRRHPLPAALLLLPDDGQRRPGGDLQDGARQRPPLQVERRHRQRLDAGARPRQPHQGHQRRRARASSPSSRWPTTPRSRSIRVASARAPSAPTWRPGTCDVEEFLDLRKNTGDDRRRTHDMHTALWVPDLFMQRVEADGDWTLFSPSDVPDLHDLYGAAFARRYAEYEAAVDAGRDRPPRRMPRGRPLAGDADRALRDRSPLDHLQGRGQRAQPAGPRRRRPQLEPLHRDPAQHQPGRGRRLQPRLGQSGRPRHRRRDRPRAAAGDGAASPCACSTT